ncbi:transcription initiation factor IIF subunit alpha-like protein, partial [Trifolium pratense]
RFSAFKANPSLYLLHLLLDVQETPLFGLGSVARQVTMGEPKSSGKDVNGSASKSNAPPKGTPLPSSNAGSSNAASGPVTEQEIRAVLMQRTPLTTQELVAKFKGRLRCAEVSSNFA